MMTPSPFRITVYDKAFRRRGWVGSPESVKATLRHNAVGSATITLDADHPRAADLMTEGARVVLDYDGDHALSGPVREWSMEGPASRALLTIVVEDDFRLLTRILGWAVPTAGLGAQVKAYDVRTGPAETAAKAVIAANVARLGLPVTVAPSKGRGANVSLSFRFHPLADRLFPAVDVAGVGLTVRQSGAGLRVDAYAPALHPRTLTEASGVVQKWEWSRKAPNASRVVAGSQGEAEARDFYGPFTRGATEALWGDVVEVFADARNTGEAGEVTATAEEKLDEGQAMTGLKVTLAETSTFRYGRAVHVGDRVRLEVGPGLIVEDVLREVSLDWTASDGLTVSPTIGDREEPMTTFARAVSNLARGIRNLTAGR